MNRKIKVFALFAIISCCSLLAQKVDVSAKIDSVHLMIGEQAVLELQVNMPTTNKATFPLFTDTIISGVDIVKSAAIDTVYSKDKQSLTLKKRYTITSFAPKMYLIPPFEIDVDGVGYKTMPMSLKVETYPDIEQVNPDDYFGMKEIMSPPFVWGDWIGFFCSLIFIIPLGFLVVYLGMRLFDNKPIIRRIKLEVPRPPHEEAMAEIEQIKSRKSWQTAGPKEYYTELTDVLREYMKKRFKFNALEMTSAEIIDQLTKLDDKKEIEYLQKLFGTADLVKFAKYKPIQGEYDNDLSKVVEYINNTMEVPDPNAKPEPTEKVIVEKRSLQTKILLGAATLLAIVAIIICVVVIFSEGADLLRSL